jgi:DNA-binding NarL/FixJ family response regulator
MARLFLCDDDADYRALLRTVLGGADHEIVGEGCDGRDCIERAPESRPDVVLLDLNMPRMSGFDALPALRSSLPDAKILILSSARRVDELERVLSLGADGYIEKPTSIFGLAGELEAALAAG